MQFNTITPNWFVIRNDDEKKQLEKILKKLGLTLVPIRKEEVPALLESDSDTDSTELYYDEEDEQQSELPNDNDNEGTDAVA